MKPGCAGFQKQLAPGGMCSLAAVRPVMGALPERLLVFFSFCSTMVACTNLVIIWIAQVMALNTAPPMGRLKF